MSSGIKMFPMYVSPNGWIRTGINERLHENGHALDLNIGNYRFSDQAYLSAAFILNRLLPDNYTLLIFNPQNKNVSNRHFHIADIEGKRGFEDENYNVELFWDIPYVRSAKDGFSNALADYIKEKKLIVKSPETPLDLIVQVPKFVSDAYGADDNRRMNVFIARLRSDIESRTDRISGKAIAYVAGFALATYLFSRQKN